jgi:hypothetical protein
VEGVILTVGPLQELVASKRAADRPKDRLFLKLHKEIIEAMLDQSTLNKSDPEP